MFRFLPAAAAFATLVAVPAFAQTPAYRAMPVTPMAAEKTIIVAEAIWKCGPAGCTSTGVTARPAIACALMAREIGKIDSFAVGPNLLDAAALAKCNVKAKA